MECILNRGKAYSRHSTCIIQKEGPLTLDDLGGHVQHSAHCIGQSVLQFSGSSKVTQLQHTAIFEEQNTVRDVRVREVGRREKERKKGREREEGGRREEGREGAMKGK